MQSLKTATIGFLGFLVFSVMAMASYQDGYSWSGNFISDLGTHLTTSGIPQPGTNLLFLLSIACLGVGIFHFFRFFSTKLQVPTFFVALLLLGVPLIPADISLWPHRIVTVGSIALVGLLAATGAILTKKLPLLISAICCLSYVAFLFLFPRPEAGPDALLIHIAVQKIAIYGQFLLLLFWSYTQSRNA